MMDELEDEWEREQYEPLDGPPRPIPEMPHGRRATAKQSLEEIRKIRAMHFAALEKEKRSA